MRLNKKEAKYLSKRKDIKVVSGRVVTKEYAAILKRNNNRARFKQDEK